MATGLNGSAFAEHLGSLTPDAEFTVKPFHEVETDSLICYFKNTPSFCKRVNNYLTMFLAQSDESLVGIELNGVDTILSAIQDLGDVPMTKEPVMVNREGGDGTMSLAIMVRCALVPDADEEPISGKCWDELTKATRRVRVPKRRRAHA